MLQFLRSPFLTRGLWLGVCLLGGLASCSSSAPTDRGPSNTSSAAPPTRRPDEPHRESLSEGEGARPASLPEQPSPEIPLLEGPIRIDVDNERRLDDAAMEAMTEQGVPGAVIVLGDDSGPVFARAYGARSLEPAHTSMALPMRFDLASVSKVFTTLLVLRLVDAGRLSLDAPLASFFPEVEAPNNAALTTRTVEDLLWHRSGLPAVDPLRAYGAGPLWEMDFDGERSAQITRIAGTPMEASGAYRYSDLGYVLLGEVATKAAALPLEEAMARWVVEPLGLGAMYAPARRGLALDTVVPTERAPRRRPPGEVPVIHGEVHDPRAYRLGGVAGHAGLFASASDLVRVAEVLSGIATLPDGTPFLSAPLTERLQQVQEVPRRNGPGRVRRTLGLEVLRAQRQRPTQGTHGDEVNSPDGSSVIVGHRGFTGTMLAVDPRRRRYAIVLSSAVHPAGEGDVAPLREVALDVLASFEVREAAEPVGLDVIQAEDFARFAGQRVGLLTHDAARARDGRRASELFRSAGVLAVLFAPEHGLSSRREGHIGDGESDGVRVVGLFGRRRDPPDEVMASIDTVVVDVQDVGVRFYTYLATMHRLLVAAARHDKPVVILDRPNPLGRTIAGPLLDMARRSFINHHPLPIQHGMTAGEIARMLVAEDNLSVALTVVPLPNWSGAPWPEARRWVPPSPNLRHLTAVHLYPGVALVEGANVSVGRGTEAPFQRVGAPWMDAARVAAALRESGAVVRVEAFTPRAGPHRRQRCQGVFIEGASDPLAVGLALTAALAQHPPFDGARCGGLYGDDQVLAAALNGESGLRQRFVRSERMFAERRAPFLLYLE